MNKKINIGVIGCASIAETYVLPAIIDSSDKYNLIGVASRDKKKAARFARKFNTQPFYSYHSLLESGSLDAVYIPLPNALHKEWIEKSIDHNIHMLVEKSLSCSYQEVFDLNERAKNEGLLLVENFQFRFHKQLSTITQLLDEGVIGELRCLRSSFGFPPFPDSKNIRYQNKLGGGALLDAGAYPIKIAQQFLGLDLTVEAANLTIDPEKNIDIWGGAYLKQKHGMLFAEIAFGFDNYYQCNLELWGNKGKIYTNRIFTAPPGFSPEVIIETSSGTQTTKFGADYSLKNMLNHFYKLYISKTVYVDEYIQNINQGRLIEELRNKALNKK